MKHWKSIRIFYSSSSFIDINKSLLKIICVPFFISLLSACSGSSSAIPSSPNQAPIAVDDNVNIAAGALFTVNVLANDTDANNNSLTLITVTQPAHGTVQLLNNSIIYQSELTYKGTDSFSYTVSDGEFEASATVSINVLFDELAPGSLTAFGGSYGQPAYNGNFLYIARGSTVSVWDMSQPQTPIEIFDTDLEPTTGIIRSLIVVNEHLFASVRGNGVGLLAIFSLLNPSQPRLIEEFEYAPLTSFNNPQGLIQVADNQLYLIDEEIGIYLIDINIPESPTATQVSNNILTSEQVKVFDSILIAGGMGGFGQQAVTFIDINDINNPILLNEWSSSGVAAIAFNKTTLMVSENDKVQIFDISSPTQVTLRAEFIPSGSQLVTPGSPLALEDDTVYIRTLDTLEIYNISNPVNPTFIKSIALDLGIVRKHLFTTAGLVYLADADKGVLLDVLSPEQTSVESNFILSGGSNVQEIAFSNNLIVALQSLYGITTHQSDDFSQLGRLDIDLPDGQIVNESLKVENNTVYMANWGFGLNIVDISNPASPSNIGKLSLGLVSDVAIDPDSQIALLGQATNGGKLYVVNIANLSQPGLSAEYAFSPVRAIEFHNGSFLVGSTGENGGLSILDFSNPADLKVLGSYSCSSGILQIAVSNNKVFMICNSELHIVDISQPISPTLLGQFSLDKFSIFGAIAVSGNRAFLGHQNGIDEINIADPSNPRLIKTIPLPVGAPMRLKISPQGYLYYLAGLTNFVLKDKE